MPLHGVGAGPRAVVVMACWHGVAAAILVAVAHGHYGPRDLLHLRLAQRHLLFDQWRTLTNTITAFTLSDQIRLRLVKIKIVAE